MLFQKDSPPPNTKMLKGIKDTVEIWIYNEHSF